MKKRLLKKVSLMTGACIIIVILGFSYYRYEQQQKKELQQQKEGQKKWTSIVYLGTMDLATDYKESSYDEKYYQLFLKNEELPIFLKYIKTALEEEVPELGYGNKYPEITMERLRDEPIEVGEELVLLNDNTRKWGKYMSTIFSDAKRKMSEDSSAFVMSVLGKGLDDKYQKAEFDYGTYEEFLTDPKLHSRLKYLKQYLKVKFPEIRYGDDISEIRIYELYNAPTKTEVVLKKIIEKLETEGVDIADILMAV